MSWLTGGPFLELSFMMEEVKQINETLQHIQNTNVKIELHNPYERIMEFYEGYLYNENDPNSKRIHQVELNLTVHTRRKRRAVLFIQRIAPETLCFSMCFFGDEDDASEWNQPGFKDEEIPEFVDLLVSLYREIDFLVGGLAIEEDVKGLFGTQEAWPHDDYKMANLSAQHINNNLSSFMTIIVNNSLNLQVQGLHSKQIDNGTLFEIQKHS